MQELNLYKIPNYLLESKYYLSYNGLISLLNKYKVGSTSIYSVVDSKTFNLNVNYYTLIEQGINYIVIDNKFCYTIVDMVMSTKNTTNVGVMFDSINSLQLINMEDVVDSVYKFFATSGLTTKLEYGMEYLPLSNTFTESEKININKITKYNDKFSFDPATPSSFTGFDLATTVKSKEITFRYYIVNKNFLPLKYIKEERLLSSFTYIEDNVVTDFIILLVPNADNGIKWHFRYGTSSWGDCKVDALNNFFSKADPANLVETGLVNLTEKHIRDKNAFVIHNSKVLKVDEWNTFVDNDTYTTTNDYQFPILTLNLYAPYSIDLQTTLDTPLKFIKKKPIIRFKDKVYDLPVTTDGTYAIDKVTTFTNGCSVLLILNKCYNQTGKYIVDVTEGAVIKLPIFIDGVQRLTMTTAQALRNDKAMVTTKALASVVSAMALDASGSYNQYKQLGGQINLVEAQKYGYTRDDMMSTIESNKNYRGIEASVSNSIGLIGEANSIRMQEYNRKFAESTYNIQGNLSYDMQFNMLVEFLTLNFNSKYTDEYIATIGFPMDRYVDLSTLSITRGTLIKGIPTFSIPLNNQFNAIYRIFSNGFLYFKSETMLKNFIDNRSEIDYFNI